MIIPNIHLHHRKRGMVGIDMLHGPMTGKIIMFALPLMLSGILQQSFVAVDVAVVGQFCSPQAMAAIGGNGVLVNILINLFLGLAVGANVVIATAIGRNDKAGVRSSVATVGLVSVISGFALILAGVLLARPMLSAMATPGDVIDLAERYLTIYFCGMPFIMTYNFGSAILRSVGDTRSPFYSLLVATAVNATLDWLLVARMGMGVGGAAVATVIANAVNAGIILKVLTSLPDPYTLHLSGLRICRKDLREMMRIGIPAGLQGMVFSLSNIFIQASINAYGAKAIAGSAAGVTFESYCYYLVTAFCAATIAFTGQNYGAGQYDRCRRVFRISMVLSIFFCASANLGIVFGENTMLRLFTDDREVISYGGVRLHSVLLLQWIACSYEIAGAYMRGLGYSMTPTVLTVFGTCVLRLVWVFFIAPMRHEFSFLLTIYPITWVLTGLMVVSAAFIVQRRVFASAPRKEKPQREDEPAEEELAEEESYS